MTINFKLLNVSKMSSLRIYILPIMKKIETLNLNSRVKLIQRVLSGTPCQKELTPLPPIHMIRQISSSPVLGAIFIKFGQ